MPRRAIFSATLPAQVRRYFGLPQWELAAFLGVSAELVKHIEAGRRTLTGPVLLRLNELARWLPATPEAPGPGRPVAPDPPAAASSADPEAAAPLLARLDVCQHRARQLRRLLARQEADWLQARRWEQVLPALLATAPPATNVSAWANQRRRWLLARQQAVEEALGAAAAVGYQLRRVRAEALEAEVAALRALLPPAAVATLTAGALLP
ncbi:helix-turn-helix domain-containing protein [Hymenobacter psychrophilus]|uniref:Helix-turn-helix n=1 Tax=Hymenobacter psychrophilus TaxID=651662 RepID=A0A1H3LPA5_9BACT|nr:hypothetical protein [Hymenobacter psychrophilus]SDY66140.1 hypothetical protein SAMN04488069_11169 [Hymenobacter psychrophilus]